MASTSPSEDAKKKKPPLIISTSAASAADASMTQSFETASVSTSAQVVDDNINQSAVSVASSSGTSNETASTSSPDRYTNQSAAPDVPNTGADNKSASSDVPNADAVNQLATSSAPSAGESIDQPAEPLSRRQQRRQWEAAGSPICSINVVYAGRSFGVCGKRHLPGQHDQAVEAVSKSVKQQHEQYRLYYGHDASKEAADFFKFVARRELGVPLQAVTSQSTQVATSMSTSASSTGTRQRRDRSRSPTSGRQQYRSRTPVRPVRSHRRRVRCQHCGRYHAGECWICTLCNGRGHLANTCTYTWPTDDRTHTIADLLRVYNDIRAARALSRRPPAPGD